MCDRRFYHQDCSNSSALAMQSRSLVLSHRYYVSCFMWIKVRLGFCFHYYCVVFGYSRLEVAFSSWWRHQIETFSALLALCPGNSPVTGEFPAQRPVPRSFDVFFYVPPNKRLRKQPWGWWIDTPSWSLWRHCNLSCLLHSLLSHDCHYADFSGTFICHVNICLFLTQRHLAMQEMWKI